MEDPAGIYIHIPFCERLCPYCDFAVAIRKHPKFGEYTDALIRELRGRSEELAGRRIQTIYFGGGTPSMMPPDQLERVFEVLAQEFQLDHIEEVTIEANPRSTTVEMIHRWQLMGIDRVSLGVQSFQQKTLDLLGRNHDADEAISALEAVLNANLRTSLDLIFCGPELGMTDLLGDIDRLKEFPRLSHVSAYQLTVEPQTVFGRRRREGTLKLPPEEEMVEAYDALREGLAELGYAQYEVSSFARLGQEGLHNRQYWQGIEYLGVGVGAHSFSKGESLVRRANSKRLKEYLADPDLSSGSETLSMLDHFDERLFLGVRGAHGVNPGRLAREFSDVSPERFEHLDAALRRMFEEGLLREEQGVWTPTALGYALADSVADRLLAGE